MFFVYKQLILISVLTVFCIVTDARVATFEEFTNIARDLARNYGLKEKTANGVVKVKTCCVSSLLRGVAGQWHISGTYGDLEKDIGAPLIHGDILQCTTKTCTKPYSFPVEWVKRFNWGARLDAKVTTGSLIPYVSFSTEFSTSYEETTTTTFKETGSFLLEQGDNCQIVYYPLVIKAPKGPDIRYSPYCQYHDWWRCDAPENKAGGVCWNKSMVEFCQSYRNKFCNGNQNGCTQSVSTQTISAVEDSFGQQIRVVGCVDARTIPGDLKKRMIGRSETGKNITMRIVE